MSKKITYQDQVKKKQEHDRKQALKTGNFITLKMPSGYDWKVLPISVHQLAICGVLPMHLVEQMENIADITDEQISDALKDNDVKVSGSQMTDFYNTVGAIMVDNVIEPRILLNPPKKEPDFEYQLVKDLYSKDLDKFTNWIQGGAQVSENNFRTSNRKKRRKSKNRRNPNKT